MLKLVYYGPGLGGKTTNLELIHARSRPEYRGKLLSLTAESERTIFFDLLPVDLGKFKDYSIRLHLCTVPGQIAYDQTRQLILRNVDGIVFIVDSQEAAIEANIESMRNLETNLRLQSLDPHRVPMLVQYNKRDLPDVLSVEELRRQLDIPRDVTEVEASAKHGDGVFMTLKLIVRECLKLAGDPAKLASGRTPSILPGKRASRIPQAEPAAVGDDAALSAPRVPSVAAARDPHRDR